MCSDPPIEPHARVTVSHVGDTGIKIATYKCEEENGYVAAGNDTSACLKGLGFEMWTPVKINCTRE